MTNSDIIERMRKAIWEHTYEDPDFEMTEIQAKKALACVLEELTGVSKDSVFNVGMFVHVDNKMKTAHIPIKDINEIAVLLTKLKELKEAV